MMGCRVSSSGVDERDWESSMQRLPSFALTKLTPQSCRSPFERLNDGMSCDCLPRKIAALDSMS